MASSQINAAGGNASTPDPPSRTVLLESVLTSAKRKDCPLRKSFVQIGRGIDTVPGPLAGIVTRADMRALDAYLLAHAAASAAPWDCTWPANTWVALLGLKSTAEEASAKAAVSKVFARLDKTHNLVDVRRSGRRSAVHLLKEDGSRDEYTRPTTRDDPWFSLPHAYWLRGYDQSLALPAKAALLIALYTKEGNWLPTEYAKSWFGINPTTLRDGLTELCDVGLLNRNVTYTPDTRSPTLWAEKVSYRRAGAIKVKKAKTPAKIAAPMKAFPKRKAPAEPVAGTPAKAVPVKQAMPVKRASAKPAAPARRPSKPSS